MIKKKSDAPRKHMEKSFQKNLLDAPLRRRRTIKYKQLYLVPLPEPLQPTPYVPPKPVPPPRRKKPIPLPRAEKARVPNPRVQKLIEEITPFYTLEAIEKYRKTVTTKAKEAQKEAFKRELASKLRNKIFIEEIKKDLKGIVQSFEVWNIPRKDP